MSGAPDAEVRIALDRPLDLGRTVAPLRHGTGDPSVRLGPGAAWFAFRTADGPASLELVLREGTRLRSRAWGPGADAAIAAARDLVGEGDDPSALVPRHDLVRDLARRFAAVRLPSSRRVLDALLPTICEQKVTGAEAHRAYRRILAALGEPAPGPLALRLPPDPARLAATPYHAFHPFGLERRRAELIRRVAAAAPRLEAAPPTALPALLRAIPGIGPWSVAEVMRVVHGDPDAVSVGDYHVPNLVAWALAGEPRGDDARMLELLAPYAGQRGRVQRLLELSGIGAPRYGPRMPVRSIAAI